MEHSPVVGIDGTHSTCDGEPRVCHLVDTDVFTTMATTAHKDRVSVIRVPAGAPIGHCVGEHALAHPALGVAAREVLCRVNDGEPVLARTPCAPDARGDGGPVAAEDARVPERAAKAGVRK